MKRPTRIENKFYSVAQDRDYINWQKYAEELEKYIDFLENNIQVGSKESIKSCPFDEEIFNPEIMILNQKFDITKPIVEELIRHVNRDNEIPDHVFSQAISEYGADEQEVIELMLKCETHEFGRYSHGYTVREIKPKK